MCWACMVGGMGCLLAKGSRSCSCCMNGHGARPVKKRNGRPVVVIPPKKKK